MFLLAGAAPAYTLVGSIGKGPDRKELERFKAVVHFEKPDYRPLPTIPGLGYIHDGGPIKLHREGLPEEINDHEKWCRYWGQCTFDHVAGIGTGAPGKMETRDSPQWP